MCSLVYLLNISYMQRCTETVTFQDKSQPMEETLASLGSFRFVNTARLSLQVGTDSCPDQSCRVRQEHLLHPVSPRDACSTCLLIFFSLGVPSSRTAPGQFEEAQLSKVSMSWGRDHYVVPAQRKYSLDPEETAKAMPQATKTECMSQQDDYHLINLRFPGRNL